MRCQFCGFDNPPERNSCEKCNRPLSNGRDVSHDSSQKSDSDRPTVVKSQVSTPSNLRATVRELSSLNVSEVEVHSDSCPNCGYNLEDGSCPNCGYQNQPTSSNPSSTDMNFGRSTVRPVRKKKDCINKFSLTQVAEDSGLPIGSAINFEGDCVELNRDNVAPGNKTITSETQAKIIFENGDWFIKDCSELKTTFVQAADKIKLENGALVLLGDQLFIFER